MHFKNNYFQSKKKVDYFKAAYSKIQQIEKEEFNKTYHSILKQIKLCGCE
ncbi:hypothetical protein HGP29_03255 [Flammeovirga sp. SR4]|uniref:Uncharacterized protein n=1 Tax=Flammeovirga agarivorans TaxID=2726742 RepID=A0A7X8SHA1_9BACT|nr:hypothetical protein [Flammeovirga agarivorans]